MTSPSERLCEVCRALYPPYGYLQADRTYLWYCREHRPTDYVRPELEPLVPKQQQGDLLSGEAIDRKGAFARFCSSGTYSWAQKFEAWILYEVPYGESGGVGGEIWRIRFESGMGPPPDDHVVGPVIKRLRDGEFVEGTGEWKSPRDRKSKGSKKEIVRRTERQ